MDIKNYLDSTYLKTALQAGVSEEQNDLLVVNCIQEAIDEQFKLVMIRPEKVSLAYRMRADQESQIKIGTVIDFPEGKASIDEKLDEAKVAIAAGADDLDFVCNYQEFKNGQVDLVKHEILLGTQLGLTHHKVVKWIIEVAALTDKEIIQICSLIKNVVVKHFNQEQLASVFVKSSTGFFKTQDNLPNGATVDTIKMMLENAAPLPVKAAGGVRTYQEAVAMIDLGVKRIGTSGAKEIASGQRTKDEY
ncbi:deoxyribose-phosphate aldolase [Flavobacterium sp. K77]|uniref:deoxyribose-phosphate aldolase n=1 Tax=Flavobacterium sp. K77 TaxID=2910676 RepID=UPI001F2A5D06|nr:deoxyribose-phosphate aldolase [Flavobacterium sp. K77]MCF6140148.1 deoxyribose-phosphate aldolase [Flavobacterium sp. K77]